MENSNRITVMIEYSNDLSENVHIKTDLCLIMVENDVDFCLFACLRKKELDISKKTLSPIVFLYS